MFRELWEDYRCILYGAYTGLLTVITFIRNRKPEFWTALATVFIAVFSVLLYFVNDRLTKDSEAVQRAFIGFNNHSVMEREISPYGTIEAFLISPVLENTGTTPGIKVRNHASGEGFNGTLPSDFSFPDKWPKGVPHDLPGPVVLAPKGSMESNIVVISADDMKNAAANPLQRPVYIWGWITYQDIFRHSHRTEFCSRVARIDPSTFDPRVIGEPAHILWSLCPVHNCTDDDCTAKKNDER